MLEKIQAVSSSAGITPGSENPGRGKPCLLDGKMYWESRVINTQNGIKIVGINQLSEEDSDQIFSDMFWDKQRRKYPDAEEYYEAKAQAMLSNLETSVKKYNGRFCMFVNQEGMDDNDRTQLAAYKVLGHQHGYELGQPVFNSDSYLISVPITRIS